MRHVSVDIVTGFLGSGKTTLLSNVLAGELEGERVAVVMNEIGDVGIDGRTITGLSFVESMVELNSGCICCSIEDYRFDLAIQELVEKVEPTLILIETTGVADPGPVVYRVEQAGLALDAVVTVVDAANLERALRETRTAKAQIEAADFLVLSKCDLVDDAMLARLRRKLGRMNPRALIVRGDRGRLESDILFATSVRRYRGAAPSSNDHLVADSIESFSVCFAEPFDQRRFERFLARLPPQIYRAKGFVRVADNPWSCLFNFTCGRYELNWVKLGEGAGETQAVFIGRDIERVRAGIEERLAACRVPGTQ